MTLAQGKKNTPYLIWGVFTEPNIERRLEALGLNDNTMVTILNAKRNGSMIIKVRGTRLAIGKQIASAIEIKEALQ